MDNIKLGVSKVCFAQKDSDVCEGELIKHGFISLGKARFKCSICNKTKVEYYTSNAYKSNTNKKIIQLAKEGLGIRSTARISTTTLLKRIVLIAQNITKPIISKLMKSMSFAHISNTRKIISGWFMHWKRILKKL